MGKQFCGNPLEKHKENRFRFEGFECRSNKIKVWICIHYCSTAIWKIISNNFQDRGFLVKQLLI